MKSVSKNVEELQESPVMRPRYVTIRNATPMLWGCACPNLKPVMTSMSRYAAVIGHQWAPFPALLAGHTYDAMWVDGDDLSANPFHLRAEALADPADEMGVQTLVVVGAVRDGTPGFVILGDRADGETGDFAGGEQLQDHGWCPAPVLSAGK